MLRTRDEHGLLVVGWVHALDERFTAWPKEYSGSLLRLLNCNPEWLTCVFNILSISQP